eukprot:snap_masked-scaffold_4-processed-gene-21.45-mRNA-1 protein AED:1.00 eAED:1.00 QI:0/0/0/0/1/1/2/0/326
MYKSFLVSRVTFTYGHILQTKYLHIALPCSVAMDLFRGRNDRFETPGLASKSRTRRRRAALGNLTNTKQKDRFKEPFSVSKPISQKKSHATARKLFEINQQLNLEKPDLCENRCNLNTCKKKLTFFQDSPLSGKARHKGLTSVKLTDDQIDSCNTLEENRARATETAANIDYLFGSDSMRNFNDKAGQYLASSILPSDKVDLSCTMSDEPDFDFDLSETELDKDECAETCIDPVNNSFSGENEYADFKEKMLEQIKSMNDPIETCSTRNQVDEEIYPDLKYLFGYSSDPNDDFKNLFLMAVHGLQEEVKLEEIDLDIVSSCFLLSA